MAPTRASSKDKGVSRSSPFKASHAAMFGLKVSLANATTQKVEGVSCRFCTIYGREGSIGKTRKQHSTNKIFQFPFRKENFCVHLKTQHPIKWQEFQALPPIQRDSFFDNVTPFVNTMLAHSDFRSDALQFEFEPGVIDILIGELMWHPADIEGETRARALSIFKKLDHEDHTSNYSVCITHIQPFALVIEFVAIGMSFKQATNAIRVTKEITGNSKLGFQTQEKTASFVRVGCAATFQCLAKLLQNVWAFSMALDGSMCLGTSYIDIRVRFVQKGMLYNLHVFAVPFRGSHTGLAQFEIVSRIFDVLCPEWKSKLLACTSDGARNMTGSVQGVVTRIEKAVLPGFFRVWCLLHQLDILMQRTYEHFGEGEFWSVLTAMIAHLRRQQTLVNEMRATCPTVSTTRWISMYRVTSFTSTRRVEILEHYESLGVGSSRGRSEPNQAWWIMNEVVCRVVGDINVVVQRLQSKTTLLSQQASELRELQLRIIDMVNVEETAGSLESISTPDNGMIVQGHWATSIVHIVEFVEDISFFTMMSLRELEEVDAEGHGNLIQEVGKMMLQIVQGLGQIVALRDAANLPSDDMIPPVMPHELVLVKGRDLSLLMLEQLERLELSWTQQEIDAISSQHHQLRQEYANNLLLKAEIDKCDHTTSFNVAWTLPTIVDRFPELCMFAGGLASVFPNTATVESDFSVLKWEKDIHRKSLSDFSLQGILHSKQYKAMRSIPM